MAFDLTVGVNSFTDANYTSDLTTKIVTSQYARIVVTTTATSVDVSAHCNNAFGGSLQSIGCFVDGVYHSAKTFANTDGVTTQTFGPFSAGTKTIEFWNGDHTAGSGADLATMSGCWMTLLSFNAAFTQLFPTSANKLIMWGDSITMGQSATPIYQNGVPALVRASYSGQLSFDGGGGSSLAYFGANSTRRADLVSRFVAGEPSLLWIAIGTNDGGTDTAFGTSYAAVIDDFHTARPACPVVAQTPFTRTDTPEEETLMESFRVKIRAIAAARSSYVTLMEGPLICNSTTHMAGDGKHISTLGQSTWATKIIEKLNNRTKGLALGLQFRF